MIMNKYRPKKIDDLSFNKDIIHLLKKMAQDNSIPHIIFHGPNGSGKRTIINFFLEMLYDKSIYDIKKIAYKIPTNSKINNILINQSDHHIIIEPTNTNNDRFLIQNIIKTYASKIPLKIFKTNRPFKVVVINNINNLLYYAQTSLRRTMEKYSNNCRFLMWCESITPVIQPLISRCMCINISVPPFKNLFGFIMDICANEKIDINVDKIFDIINKSNGNIREIFGSLDWYYYKREPLYTYKNAIEQVGKLILKKNINEIKNIRKFLYNMTITTINSSVILNDLIYYVVKNISDNEKKIKILNYSAKCDINMIKARRDVIHFDDFVINVMNII